MTETRPQGAQQDLLVKISVLLILSHSESCVPTARLEHLLHGGRRSCPLISAHPNTKAIKAVNLELWDISADLFSDLGAVLTTI